MLNKQFGYSLYQKELKNWLNQIGSWKIKAFRKLKQRFHKTN